MGFLPLFLLHLLGHSGPPAGGRFGPAGGAAGGGVLLECPGPGGGGWVWPSSRSFSSSICVPSINDTKLFLCAIITFLVNRQSKSTVVKQATY